MTAAMEKICGAAARIENVTSRVPFYIDADSPAIQTLISTYNDVTGEGKTPFTMGGGTYARHFPYAVSFGPEHTDIASLTLPVPCTAPTRAPRLRSSLRPSRSISWPCSACRRSSCKSQPGSFRCRAFFFVGLLIFIQQFNSASVAKIVAILAGSAQNCRLLA